jgi:arylsulfatase
MVAGFMLTRRQFLAGTAAASLRAQTPAKPNILLIMADDMGFSDIGCYGGEIDTPNLDGMARRGVRFTQFYNGARCCPTRAALLTGLYAHQAGIGHMIDDRGAPSYQGKLNDRCVTIAEVLRTAGYRTMMSGKWHVGEERPHWPTDRGFDRFFGLISGASNYFRLDAGRAMAVNSTPYTPPSDTPFYMTDAFADHAIEQLDEAGKSGKPWFQYLAYTAPHWPLHAPEEDIRKYEGKYSMGWDELRRRRHARMVEIGVIDPQWKVSERDPDAPAWESAPGKEEHDRRMAVYAAQIDRMDRSIGRVLTKIRAMGQEDNTLILFLADNGGCAEKVERGEKGAITGSPDSYTSYGLPWANASNTPFRSFKHWVHEGGIATPLIAYWPAAIRNGGKFNREPSHLIDIMATCVDISGARYPPGMPAMEGRSLAPVFRGRTRDAREALFWEHEGNRAVRQGRWKLVSRFKPGTWELYDVEKDRTETNDLAALEPGRVKKMSTLYDAWAKRVGVLPWEQVQKMRPRV